MVTLGLATATASADDLTLSADAGLDLATAAALAYPIGVIGPAPLADAAPSLQLQVCDPDGTPIAWLPRSRGVQFAEELNGTGSASIQVARYDDIATAHTDLWDDDNLVKVYLAGVPVFVWRMETWAHDVDDNGAVWLTRAGRGWLADLEKAVLYPEYGLKTDGSDTRAFNYGSKRVGAWYVAADWRTPRGVRVYRSKPRRRLPKHWPHPGSTCEWLWSRSPDRTSPNGDNWFRGSFDTTGSSTRVRVWAVGDDQMQLRVDGDMVLRHAKGAWKKAKSVTLDLDSGTHIVAAKVTNTPRGGDNRSGFLCLVAEVDGKGRIKDVLLRSKTSTMDVHGYKRAPGWSYGDVLRQHLVEAQARSVRFHDGITIGWSSTKDSAGNLWTNHDALAYPVLTDGLSLAGSLCEQGMDMHRRPSGRLDCCRRRGVDRSRFVTLRSSGYSESGGSSRIRTKGIARFKDGWVWADDWTGDGHGIRETGVDLGNAGSHDAAVRQLKRAMSDGSQAEHTTTVTILATSGPQPYLQFDLGDTVSYVAPGTGITKGRVMSLAASVDDSTGTLSWDVGIYQSSAGAA